MIIKILNKIKTGNNFIDAILFMLLLSVPMLLYAGLFRILAHYIGIWAIFLQLFLIAFYLAFQAAKLVNE